MSDAREEMQVARNLLQNGFPMAALKTLDAALATRPAGESAGVADWLDRITYPDNFSAWSVERRNDFSRGVIAAALAARASQPSAGETDRG